MVISTSTSDMYEPKFWKTLVKSSYCFLTWSRLFCSVVFFTASCLRAILRPVLASSRKPYSDCLSQTRTRFLWDWDRQQSHRLSSQEDSVSEKPNVVHFPFTGCFYASDLTSSSLASTIRPVGHRFGTLRTTTKSTRFRTASICVSFPTRFVYDFTDILCAYWNANNWLEYKWFHWYFMRVVQCKWMVSIFHWYLLYKYCKWILCIGADTLIFNVN